MNVQYYENPEELAGSVAYRLLAEIKKKVELTEKFYLAVSGGTTPRILFDLLAKEPFKSDVLWQFLHIFWVDERCVPPESKESNYGEAKRILLDKVNIPAKNIHRMIGENNPLEEIHRYAAEIKEYLFVKNNIPVFDWIWLGMGNDGHTASLFPGKDLIDISKDIIAIAEHPETGQKRITLTLKIINNAELVSFLVTGKDKESVFKAILNNEPGSGNYPASHINPSSGNLEWLVSY